MKLLVMHSKIQIVRLIILVKNHLHWKEVYYSLPLINKIMKTNNEIDNGIMVILKFEKMNLMHS